eukprot:5062396-Heterocapsa_arctica.AAC.1
MPARPGSLVSGRSVRVHRQHPFLFCPAGLTRPRCTNAGVALKGPQGTLHFGDSLAEAVELSDREGEKRVA